MELVDSRKRGKNIDLMHTMLPFAIACFLSINLENILSYLSRHIRKLKIEAFTSFYLLHAAIE